MNAEFDVELLEPARIFIYRLKPKMQNKALRAVALLERFGYRLTEPNVKNFRMQTGLKSCAYSFQAIYADCFTSITGVSCVS